MRIHILLLVASIPFISAAQIIHHVSFDSYKLVESIDEKYIEIEMSGLGNCWQMEGEPVLPRKSFRLSIPPGNEVGEIEIINAKSETVQLQKKLLPFQGERDISDVAERAFVEPLDSIYKSGKNYPESLITSKTIGYFDYDNQILTVDITPFRYNAEANRLVFYKSFDIKVQLKSAAALKGSQINFSRQPGPLQQQERNRILKTLVDNPASIQLKPISNETNSKAAATIPKELSYEYVIITSAGLAPYFNKFVNWKKRKGINIGIVTMDYVRANYTGDLVSNIYDDAGKLRQFLFEAYQNGLCYALLGGSKEHVPIRIGAFINNSYLNENNPPTDSYFSDFNGNWNVDGDNLYGEPTDDAPDYMAEIFVGRVLCVTPEHVQNWTEKAILYETNPGNGDYAYLKKALYTQADQMQRDFWAADLIPRFPYYSTNKVMEETYNGVKDYASAGVPQFPTGVDVIDEINKNYGLITIMGHGSPCGVAVATTRLNGSPQMNVYASSTFHPSYRDSTGAGFLENMTNYNYPNINCSVSCDNAAFDDNQEWHSGHTDNVVKRFTVTSKAGSVAFLGNSRAGKINGSLYLFQYFGDEINSGNYSLGVAEANSKARVSPSFPWDRTIKYGHNLFGCPEMEIWTNTPSQFSANVIRSGSSVGITGVLGAKVCVMSAHDNGESYYQIKTPTTANCIFTNVPDPFLVTITKHNYIPFLYPNDIYIQNKEHNSGSYYISGSNIKVGSNVTATQPQGPVVIQGSANVVFDAENGVTLEGGFEAKKGATFEAK